MKLRKNGQLDMRYTQNRDYDRLVVRNRYLGTVVLGILAGIILTITLFRATHASPEDIGSMIVPHVAEVIAEDYSRSYYEAEPLRYIRFRGEELGYNEYDISKFIRIARAESGLNQYAKNPNSTAKGIYQFIDSTWRQYCLKDGNVYNFVDNINCFYKVLEVDGFPKGLNHWNASKTVWQ